MFGIEPSEFLLVAIVALVVIGPKDLPRAMRVVGQWVGRARGMARHFRSGFDEMVRQAELEEMEKRWAAENARIMAEHPATEAPAEEAHDAEFARPLPSPDPPIESHVAPLPGPDDSTAPVEPKAPARPRKSRARKADAPSEPQPEPAPAPAESMPVAVPAASDQPGLPFAMPAAADAPRKPADPE